MSEKTVKVNITSHPLSREENGVSFNVKKGAAKFGQLVVSKGGIRWRPKEQMGPSFISWNDLDKLARDYAIERVGDDAIVQSLEAARDELKRITAPRNIKPDERDKLASCLKVSRAKGPIFIRPGLIDGDATLIADDLQKIFEEAGGFDRKEWPEPALSWMSPGIFLVVTDLHHAPQHATEIQKCFWAAGRQIFGWADPKHPTDSVPIGIGPKL